MTEIEQERDFLETPTPTPILANNILNEELNQGRFELRGWTEKKLSAKIIRPKHLSR